MGFVGEMAQETRIFRDSMAARFCPFVCFIFPSAQEAAMPPPHRLTISSTLLTETEEKLKIFFLVFFEIIFVMLVFLIFRRQQLTYKNASSVNLKRF